MFLDERRSEDDDIRKLLACLHIIADEGVYCGSRPTPSVFSSALKSAVKH